MNTLGKVLIGLGAAVTAFFVVRQVFKKKPIAETRKMSQADADKLVLEIEKIKEWLKSAKTTSAFPNAWEAIVIKLNEAGYMFQQKTENTPSQAIYKGGVYHQYPQYTYSDSASAKANKIAQNSSQKSRFTQALGSANA